MERPPGFVEECEAAHEQFIVNTQRSWRAAPANEWSKFAMLLERRAPSTHARPQDQLLYTAATEMDPQQFQKCLADGLAEMRERFSPALPAPAVCEAKDAEFEVRDS